MLGRVGSTLWNSGNRCLAARVSPACQSAALRLERPSAIPFRVGFCSTGSPEESEEALKEKIAQAKEQVEELIQKKINVGDDASQALKRHKTDLENESKYAVTKFAKEVIKVADNLERASSSVKPEDLEIDSDLRKMHAGVAHMDKVLAEALKEYGVVKMECMDQPFNPEHHEAMFAMPMPGKDPNLIFHVMEPGYMIKERTLRAAKVGVTRE